MPSAKIMVVDDEPDIIQVLSMRLKSAGYDVIAATDGLTATQRATREQPDLIILDIGLPGGDGHTVAERLKGNVKTMSIPVVYLTARNSQEDMKRANELGAAGYLMKPFKPERLLDVVTRVIVSGA